MVKKTCQNAKCVFLFSRCFFFTLAQVYKNITLLREMGQSVKCISAMLCVQNQLNIRMRDCWLLNVFPN
jgi:hypothetical protein